MKIVECDFTTKIKGKVLFNEPMRNHTTFHIGGPADILIIPEDLDDIRYSITYAKKRRIPVHVIGNGSKILVSDEGIRGMVIKIAKTLDDVEVSGNCIIAGAGCPLSKLIKIATLNKLGGIEFATGIPGTLGGAITMNAGTYLGSMSDIVSNVSVMDLLSGSLHTLTKDDCCFRYRDSIFRKKKLIILKAEMKMRRSNQKRIEEKINDILEKRKRTQPLDKYNAGSIFKNTSKFPAGKLVEMVELSGFRRGDAQISKIHANFIVNLGNAKADDVIFLITLAQERVKERFNVALEPEIILMGNF